MFKGISKAFKKVGTALKKVTLKGVVSGAAKVASSIPIVGGLIGTIAEAATKAKVDAGAAQAVAEQRIGTIAAGGTVAPVVGTYPNTAPGFFSNPQNLLMVGVAGVAVLLLMRRR